MRIGRISYWSAECFDNAKTLGLEFIEVCCTSENEARKFISQKDEIKAQIERTGIPISSIGRWRHNYNENGAINEEKFESYLLLLDTAIELGAKTFVCGINLDESVSLEENYKTAIKVFKTLIQRAAGRIKVAVHNCDWCNFINSPTQWQVVLGALPELYLKYDPSHAYNRGDDYLSELSDWGERIAHIHLKGAVRAGKRKIDDPPAGMDDINWPAVMGILYSRGYDGDLSCEPHSPVWRGEKEARGIAFTRDYIKQFII